MANAIDNGDLETVSILYRKNALLGSLGDKAGLSVFIIEYMVEYMVQKINKKKTQYMQLALFNACSNNATHSHYLTHVQKFVI